jgi:hypothetical protein
MRRFHYSLSGALQEKKAVLILNERKPMQFQGRWLLAHFQSRSLLVDKQALPLLIPPNLSCLWNIFVDLKSSTRIIGFILRDTTKSFFFVWNPQLLRQEKLSSREYDEHSSPAFTVYAILGFLQTHPKLGLGGYIPPPGWRNPPTVLLHCFLARAWVGISHAQLRPGLCNARSYCLVGCTKFRLAYFVSVLWAKLPTPPPRRPVDQQTSQSIIVSSWFILGTVVCPRILPVWYPTATTTTSIESFLDGSS